MIPLLHDNSIANINRQMLFYSYNYAQLASILMKCYNAYLKCDIKSGIPLCGWIKDICTNVAIAM